jgi:putative ABC transport system ATP-binding protein
MATISASKLTKSYKQGEKTVQAIHNIDLEINAGEMLVLTGRSGSGKSTLLYMLAGLLTPTSGDLTVANQQPYQLSSKERNHFRGQNIGILYPDFRLLPYLNIEDNVATPSMVLDWDQQKITECVESLMDEFDITSRANHLPEALSSGEQQRAALARALFAVPDLIIADEPTGNLDEDNSRAITTTLKNYANSGKTVIIATHDPIAIELADRVINLDKGIIA